MKRLKTFCVFFLAVTVIASLGACSSKKAGVTSYSYESSKSSVSKTAGKEYYISQSDRQSLEKLTSSGTSLIYFDKKTYGVSIYDLNSKKLWSSLPETYRSEQPSVVSLDVVADGKSYTLSSQTDCVVQKGALYEKGENSVTVNYSFRKSLDSGVRISLTVPVVFQVEQGVLSVSVDCGKIENEDNSDSVFVRSLSLLNYFGAGSDGIDGDFIFVPDGCGAVIDTSKTAEKFSPVTVPVYSSDGGKYLAKVPCFAIKSGNSAFAAVIESGDAISALHVDRARKDNGYNRIGAVFTLTETETDKETKTLLVSDRSYGGEIKISYRFLSGDAANYSGIAAACREALTRNGVLNFSSDTEQAELPMLLELSGSDYAPENGKLTSLTGFNEAQEILSLLRGKGIGNMYVRYCGIFSDGPLQSSLSKLKLSSSLGSRSDFRNLLDYASSQNIKIFADANLVSGKDNKKSKSAVSLSGEAAAVSYSSLTSFSASSGVTSRLISPGQIENSANRIIAFGRDMNLDGISLSDAGKLLYSDFSTENGSDRQTVRSFIAAESDAVSSSLSLMVDSPAVYSLKYARAAVNLPDESEVGNLEGASAVPFLQILLHGLCDYSGKPLNLYKNFETGLLKAVEYG
ncbi:MAG: DUF5696 domain-containing protein, partial [Acutalibacteraceae bacterium]